MLVLPTTSAPTFPNVGVSLDFLISILESDDMITPMHLLAGISRADIDAKDLPALRDLCKELRVLATPDISDDLEFQTYSGQVPQPREFFVNALCQPPTTMVHINFCIVKPKTKDLGGSYAEKILKESRPEWVGIPTDFCSHVWKSSFRDFVTSLQHEAAQRGPTATPRFYWNDVFVEDQNTSEEKPEDYFYTAFRDAVASIGRTLLVMGSLRNSKPLTRAWCIWEIFSTITAADAELVVVMPPSAQAELEEMLRCNLKDVIKIVMGVKTERSEAFRDYDRDEIHRIISEQCEGGFEGVNGAICEGLRGWLSSAALRLVSGVVEGEEVVEELRLMNQVGFMLKEQGRLEEAEAVFRRGLAGKERVLGVDDPSTLTSVGNLGMLLKAQGKLEEAEAQCRRALEGRERVLVVDHPDTLTSVNNLAVLLEAQGNLNEAEPLYERALERKERVFGVDHPSTLISVSNLGALLYAQGKLNEAEPLFRRALERYKRVLGVDHRKTLTAVNNLGGLLKAQGKLEEAETLCRRALEGRERVLGVEHPHTLTSVINLGTLLQEQGKSEEAELQYRRALEGCVRVLGPNHPDALLSMSNLAALLNSRNHFAQLSGGRYVFL